MLHSVVSVHQKLVLSVRSLTSCLTALTSCMNIEYNNLKENTFRMPLYIWPS